MYAGSATMAPDAPRRPPVRVRPPYVPPPPKYDRDPAKYIAYWREKAAELDALSRFVADERQAQSFRDDADDWRRMADDLAARHGLADADGTERAEGVGVAITARRRTAADPDAQLFTPARSPR